MASGRECSVLKPIILSEAVISVYFLVYQTGLANVAILMPKENIFNHVLLYIDLKFYIIIAINKTLFHKALATSIHLC